MCLILFLNTFVRNKVSLINETVFRSFSEDGRNHSKNTEKVITSWKKEITKLPLKLAILGPVQSYVVLLPLNSIK